MAKSTKPATRKSQRPTTAQIVSKLKRKGGKTASELGTTTLHLRELEAENVVKNTGKRETGKRGRPSFEWALA